MKGSSLWLVLTVLLAVSLCISVSKPRNKRRKQGTNSLRLRAGNGFSVHSQPLSRRKKSATEPTDNDGEAKSTAKRRKPKRKVQKKKPTKPKKVKPEEENAVAKLIVNQTSARTVERDLYEDEPGAGRTEYTSPEWLPHFAKRKCKKCIWQECPAVDVMKRHCPSGLVRDQCNCCPQCANGVGMPCYTSNVKLSQIWLPSCGDDLECIPAFDEEFNSRSDGSWGNGRRSEGICSCKDRTPICGSNNATYDNICEFREASVRMLIHTNTNVTILHHGPCRTAPKIDSAPLDAVASIGHVVSFRCETSGFPLPRVQWFKRKEVSDGTGEEELPGYLNHAVTQMRGGPGKYQLTTWLTLDKIKRSDKGSYICRSSNEFGMADHSAVLAITES